MRKSEAIIESVRKGMREAMMDAARDGETRCGYSQQVGEAWVDIESREVVMLWGGIMTVHDVHVSHVDTLHHSPLLESAIEGVLPEWEDIEEEVMLTA